MATASVVLTRGTLYSSRNALEIFHSACPVADRRFNVCFKRLKMHFAFEREIKVNKLLIS